MMWNRLLCRFALALARNPMRARGVMGLVGGTIAAVGVLSAWLNLRFLAAPQPLFEALHENVGLLAIGLVWLGSTLALSGLFLWLAVLAHRSARGQLEAQDTLRAMSRRACGGKGP